MQLCFTLTYRKWQSAAFQFSQVLRKASLSFLLLFFQSQPVEKDVLEEKKREGERERKSEESERREISSQISKTSA